MFAMIDQTPFLQGVMAGLGYTPMDILVEVAMTHGKTLDELTREDYMRCKRAWINFLVKLVHTPGRQSDSKQIQHLLLVCTKEVEVGYFTPAVPKKKAKGRPRKYPQ